MRVSRPAAPWRLAAPAALVTLAALALLVAPAPPPGFGRVSAQTVDAPKRGAFAPADQPPQYPSDRLYDLQHLRLELAFDLRRRAAPGPPTAVPAPLRSGREDVGGSARARGAAQVESQLETQVHCH